MVPTSHIIFPSFAPILTCNLLKDAAKRYAKYWDARRDICENDEVAFQPATLDSEALKNDSAALSMGLCQLLPHKDPSGRSILFMDSSRQDHSLISVKSQARAAAYTLMAALEDETTQRKGIVVIFWPAKERWDQPNREFISLMGSSVRGALPRTYTIQILCSVMFLGLTSISRFLES